MTAKHNGCAATPDSDGSPSSEIPQLLEIVHRMLGFVPAWLKKLAFGRSIFHLLLSPDYCTEWGRNNPFEVFMSQFDIQGQLQHRHPLVQSLYLWSRSILPNYTLFAERLEMAHAVEVRIPFLDHELFDLVRKLPPSLLIRGTKEKYILREATRAYLTGTVYARRKHPFFAPPLPSDDKNRLQILVQDTLRGAALASLPFFDQSAVIALLDKMPGMDSSVRTALDPAIMMLVCTCILQSHYRLC
jgi:asparagine synthase (glutamine-hydrolysing)